MKTTFRPITLTFSRSWPLPRQFLSPNPQTQSSLGGRPGGLKGIQIDALALFTLRKRHCTSPWMANCCLSKMDPIFFLSICCSKTSSCCESTNSPFVLITLTYERGTIELGWILISKSCDLEVWRFNSFLRRNQYIHILEFSVSLTLFYKYQINL